MLNKNNRLIKKNDFNNVFKKGRKYKLYGFKIYLTVNENNLKHSRFGFIVSKKVFQKAVNRNKIKRRLRWVIRDSLDKIRKGFDVVIIVIPGFKEENFPLIKKNINNLFQKAGILNKFNKNEYN